jgi:hypothetical protein
MASTRSIVGNSPEPELVVEPGAHDVVAFVNSKLLVKDGPGLV